MLQRDLRMAQKPSSVAEFKKKKIFKEEWVKIPVLAAKGGTASY